MDKIRDEIMEVLGNGEIRGNEYYLPDMMLDRNVYLEVNKVLENAGGKWNRKNKSHVFASGVDKVEQMLDSGYTVDEKKLYQFYETPKWLVEKMVKMAGVNADDMVLEPSAGHGAIMDVLRENDIPVWGAEIDEEKVKVLEGKGHACFRTDFLEWKPLVSFNKILMNPPFTKSQDVKHVLHAYGILRSGGIIVAIMSAGIMFRQGKIYKQLQDIIDAEGFIEPLPEGTFKDSGTMINSVLVLIEKGLIM